MDKPFNHNLRIRPVEEKDVAQFNELLSYVFQVTKSDIEESGFENKREMIKSKKPILELSKVFGWFNNEQLVSQIAIYPCEVNIHGTLYKMGGVTGVGTYPEYAGHGLMNELIRVSLENMRANQQWISYLYPYSIPYYRRKGWEIMSDKLTFKIRDTQLPKTVDVPGMVERQEVDHEDVYKVYNQFAKENHGALQRTKFNWEEYWRYENEEQRTAAIYYGVDGEPKGVLFYWIAEEVFHIKEMFYLNQEARNGLWNFITAHFSMVYWIQGNIYKNEPLAFLLEDGQIRETIEPYFMARIVDVEEFLKVFPFKPFRKNFHFVVSDPLAQWNNGIFGLIWENEQLQVVREAVGEPVYLDIQTLTCLLMNYRRAAYLARIERIETDKETLRTLERIIPDMAAYFSDDF
ncbi:acetyltransferase [Enterococcus sp. DIV2402]|uniref:Acetyltransferase n=1 Tax=Candidatus Enterococcus lowellii TaxID=2230877 RepID=A0ABZ2SMJ6_9ENTE|nr:GNAT family N-acetyltransferase [Enterococcus sp. DIV2402]MBO0464128.1 GNAT family N-acetyltransferase [Enterococcus sp. DIV2402]